MDTAVYTDKTVRPLVGEDWAVDRIATNRKTAAYVGADVSSARGARNLAARLEAYHRERGEDVAFEVYFVGSDESGHSVFSARPRVSKKRAAVEYDRNFPKALILETLKGFPDMTYAALMKPRGRGRRPILEAAARAACVRAIKAARPNISARQIGLLLSVADVTVAEALRRAQ